MGLGIGVSYAPEVVELEKETRLIQNAVLIQSNAFWRLQSIDAKINDLM
jgi:hypothetical protein